VVGKKCIGHYAADRVLASFRDTRELLRPYDCTKTLCEEWRHKVLQASLWTIMLGGGYCQVWDMTGLQQRMQQSFPQIVHT